MKIVFVDTTVDGLLIGGGHLYLPGLMKGLIQRGHEVHLVVKGQPHQRIAGMIKDSGAIVHIQPWEKKGLVDEQAMAFAEWVNRLNPDVYVISASADIGWLALPLLNPEIGTLTIGHNDEETFYMPARHYHSFLTRTVGVSQEICDHYHTDANIPSEKIEWIPYGVPTSPAEPAGNSPGKLQIVYVGRVVEEQKRISDLLAIAKLLSARAVDYKLTIVGDGPGMPKVKEVLADEIQQGTVDLKGWLVNAEIMDILRQSEVFVLTSAYEGFCIALVEAMANGCCPVVTDIRSGNKALVKDAVSGFIVSVGDTEKFAERLTELANDREKLIRMRKNAWHEGEQYSVDRMVMAYENCFTKASTDARSVLRQTDAGFPLMESCRSKYPRWIRKLKAMVKV